VNCTYHEFLVNEGFEPDQEAPDGFQAFSSAYSTRLPEEYGKPAYLAREASRFIRENQTQPFILYVSIFEPHQPYFGPRDDQYDPSQVTLPPNFGNVPTAAQTLKSRVLYHMYEEYGFKVPLKTEQDWRQLIANYWGLCSLVDTHVGTILDALEECGLDDNTIVVFTSDHGDMMGSHRLRGKGLMFEESVRVPLLIRLPGQGTGKRVKGAVSHIDLVPTLLDLMDQQIPDHLQGKSLRPLLQQSGTPSHEEDVFIEWRGPLWPEPESYPEAIRGIISEADAKASFNDPVRTIVTPDGWKFNCSPFGEHELYNLREDPIETRNLARDSRRRSLTQDLTARIRRWQEETGDT
jgi:arylsulfatase A-like enzyme